MTRYTGIITKRGTSTRRLTLDMSDVEAWRQVLLAQPARVERMAGGLERKHAAVIASRARSNAPRSQGEPSEMSRKYGPLYAQIRPVLNSRRSMATIGTAFYGLFLEKGTKRGITARPFFGPAIRKQRKPFVDDARRAVLKILRRTSL